MVHNCKREVLALQLLCHVTVSLADSSSAAGAFKMKTATFRRVDAVSESQRLETFLVHTATRLCSELPHTLRHSERQGTAMSRVSAAQAGTLGQQRNCIVNFGTSNTRSRYSTNLQTPSNSIFDENLTVDSREVYGYIRFITVSTKSQHMYLS